MRVGVRRVVVMTTSTGIAGSLFRTTFVSNVDSRKAIESVSRVSAPLYTTIWVPLRPEVFGLVVGADALNP